MRLASARGPKPDLHKGLGRGSSNDAVAIGSRIQALSTDRLLERYHELVDLRLAGRIDLSESFELGRIESRLDMEDEGELSRLTARRKEWQRERGELVTSIESLLARLKAAS